MSVSTGLPRWDMTPIFPSLTSDELARATHEIAEQLGTLTSLFDAEGIERRDATPVHSASIATLERLLAELDAITSRLRTVSAYIGAFVTTDTRDEVAQAKRSEAQQLGVTLAKLRTRFAAWVGGMEIEAALGASANAREYAFMLRKTHEAARHLMSPAEEDLASELNITGGSAFGQLHANMTAQLLVHVPLPDGARDLPMSAVRNLAYDPNREVRRRAYEAELAAWGDISVPMAAALNGVKGHVGVVAARRAWASPLDAALFEAHIDSATLDAMMGAAREFFPEMRSYLRAKARALGVEHLAWYDLFAPLGGETGEAWTFETSREFIVRQFEAYSPRLSTFAARAFDQRWIDAEPREGKQDGAYCMWVRGDESRVFANFKPAFPGMSTLAHELGHAYHNMLLAPRAMLQRDTPMTLAETASIFCETIVRNAALESAGEAERREIIEASLLNACQLIVDITSRFLFEREVFDRRTKRELSARELCEIMTRAQLETYGDGLDPQALHPWMWAVKPHYYSTGRSFYNFPYMFGFLFGLGLYAHYQADPEAFRSRYDDLLSSTGLADAATLAQRFGIDIRSRAFWASSLSIVKQDIDRFEGL